MGLDGFLNIQTLKKFPNFYQYLKHHRKFYILPKHYKIGLIKDVTTGQIVSPFSDDVIEVTYEIQKSIFRLPENKYIGFLINGQISPNSYQQSIFKQDPTFQLDQTFLIFDLLNENKDYDTRLETLKLIVTNINLNQISIYEPKTIYFNNQESNKSIWERIFMFLTEGDILLRSYDSELILDFDILISKDYHIRQCKIVQKKESKKYQYFIGKINNKYDTIISGITKDDFQNIQENDTILISTRKKYDDFLDSVFIQKQF